MSRITRILMAGVLALSLVVSSGCQRTVSVRVGTKVVCTYGEVISDDTRTVKVPAKNASKYKVRLVAKTCDKHTQLETLYDDAQKLIGKGDYDGAQKKLTQVIALDPTYASASSQSKEIAAGRKPKPDTGGGTPAPTKPSQPATKPGEGDTGVPSASLLVWTPDSMSGYQAAKPIIDPLNVSREYVPSGSTPVSFVIVAEQDSTPAGAAAALKRQVKSRYPKNADSVEVNGHSAYFGTDGRRFAVLGFTSGSVMVALEMSGTPGKNPKSLKGALLKAAGQLP